MKKTEEVQKYLESVWKSPNTDEIDDTKPIFVFLKTGDIRKCRYNKTNKTFYIKNKTIMFKTNIIKWAYVEDLI